MCLQQDACSDEHANLHVLAQQALDFSARVLAIEARPQQVRIVRPYPAVATAERTSMTDAVAAAQARVERTRTLLTTATQHQMALQQQLLAINSTAGLPIYTHHTHALLATVLHCTHCCPVFCPSHGHTTRAI